MANIDDGFTVELISLKDEVLITTSTSNPAVSGFEAPQGSLILYQNGANSTLFIKSNISDTSWTTPITSVGIAVPTFLNVSNSPLTSNGTITIGVEQQPANTFLAGPTSGGSAAPTFRTLTINDFQLSLYHENPSSPIVASATGINSVAIGNNSLASATNSIAIGDGTDARRYGQRAFGGGEFTSAGDAQTGMYTLRNITTNNTVTELFLDGSSQRLILPNNSMFAFVIYVAARRTDTTGGYASYKFEGGIKKDTTNGTTLFQGTSKTLIGETDGVWDANIQADTTNGSLRINVVGQNGKTIRWVATVITTEVTN